MTYEKDPFKLEEIPDYALQPAKEADEYNFHYAPKGAAGRFDPAAYEKILHDSVNRAAEGEEQPEFFPPTLEELLPGAYIDQAEAADVNLSREAAGDGESDLLEMPVSAAPPEEPAAEEPQEELAAVAEPQEEVAAAAEPQEEAAAEPQEEAAAEATEPELSQAAIPVFTKPAVTRPVLQPAFVPKTVAPKIVPTLGSTLSSKLKLVDMKAKEPLRITIDEDILVPDIKPDLARILSMDGKIRLSEREIHTGQTPTDRIKISGDLILQTLYAPENMVDGEPIVAIESRIPFKTEAEIKAGPNSDLDIAPGIASLDFTVVNERKFRVSAVAVLGIREYSTVDVEVFEGLKDEEVQMLKEKISLTDVAMRKTESLEIKDDFALKESMPDILKVLKYDVNVVENHKQITKEKAVINASVSCSVLYLGAEENPEAAEAAGVDEAPEIEAIPVLYQGKTEFTQFIRLDGDANASEQNPAGSRVNFNVASLTLTPKEDGNGKRNIFELDMNVDTSLEIYKNIEKEVVTDVYHHRKDVQFEADDMAVTALSGSGVSEISAREIVNVPERYGNVDKVVYLSGTISEKRSFVEQAKSVVEGVVTVNLLCTSADAQKDVFSITQEIPFRSAMEIPGIVPGMTASNDIALKELWFDKINNKQIEVNAGILVNTAVSSQESHKLVKNISLLESPQENAPLPGITLYIARTGDTIWKIAKKYRTTIDEIRKINEIEMATEVRPGTKLLIVGKHH